MTLKKGITNLSTNSTIPKTKKNRSKKISNFIISLLGLLSATVGTICLGTKVPGLMAKHKNEVQLFAAGLVFPNPNHSTSTPNELTVKNSENVPEDPDVPEDSSSNSQVEESPEETHPSDEKTYKIIESQLGASGTKCNNFYVKKDTNLDVNMDNELTLKPDIKIKKDGTPQVLIYHTHTTESYMKEDKGFYYESFYPRSTDNNFNVTQVGNNISQTLESNGIGVIHDITMHDSPSYNGSYSRSIKTIEKNLAEHPSIQVTVDIHRDSLGGNETGKIKPTFKVGNKKAAQIMIMAGCDEDGSLEFPDWEYNLRLALRLQNTAENMYPGMTRPMYFGDVKYNMHMTHGSLLIEVGSDANTLDEAKYTGTLLGNVLSKVLSECT